MNTQSASKKNDAAREAKNKYLREWRRNNPDKVKAANARYWEKKAAEMKSVEGMATSSETK